MAVAVSRCAVRSALDGYRQARGVVERARAFERLWAADLSAARLALRWEALAALEQVRARAGRGRRLVVWRLRRVERRLGARVRGACGE